MQTECRMAFGNRVQLTRLIILSSITLSVDREIKLTMRPARPGLRHQKVKMRGGIDGPLKF
jgi:hypothetical protein